MQERVAAGVSYKDMLREFGAIGMLIAATMIIMQVGQIFGFPLWLSILLIALATGGYAAYTRSAGRALFIFFLLLMIPLATTELGVDSWITALMEGEMAEIGINAGWVLIYTSAIMLVLRFFAGDIAHRISPLGLLAVCSAIAAVGLFMLSATAGIMILLAATLYGIGKTFFWPTTLAVVADQFPRGGALTMNAVAGVGMLAVGVVGAPFMGYLQDSNIDNNLFSRAPQVHEQVMEPNNSIFGDYQSIDPAEVTDENQPMITEVTEESRKDALRTIALLPILMMLCYIGLIIYFRSRGGYEPEEIAVSEQAEREEEVREAATQA